MFGFGAHYCVICGRKVHGGSHVRESDKDFCSEEHAKQYARETKRARQVKLSRQFNQAKRAGTKDQQASHNCC